MSRERKQWRVMGGVLFAVLFIAGIIFGNVLGSAPFPRPPATNAEIVRYFAESGSAVLVRGLLFVGSALSLFLFVTSVAAFVRRIAGKKGRLSRLTWGAGTLAAVFLLLSTFLAWILTLTAEGVNPALAGTLRHLSFLAGGPIHVPLLGLFVGASSMAALRAKTLPRWITWLGCGAAALSLLSVFSLVWFPVSALLPLGRLLVFVWSIVVGIVLARGGMRVETLQAEA